MLTRCCSVRRLQRVATVAISRAIVGTNECIIPRTSAWNASMFVRLNSIVRSYGATPCRNIFKDERDGDWELLRTGDPFEGDENAHLKDWELVIKRTCDIVDEITDKQPHKTLHIYCQPDFALALGKRNIFSMGGCTDDKILFEETKDMIQYQDTVQMVDFSIELPYRHRSHQLVICLCPPERTNVIPMSEVSRILNFDGYAIIGATGRFASCV